MPELLRIDDLVVAYDGFRALDGLSWAVGAGEIRVLIGPNGAGKSTLLDAIVGKASIASGQVVFEGRRLRGLPESRIVALGVGRKFQAPGVLEDLSVADNVALAVRRRKGWLAAFRGSLEAGERERVRELLALAELDERPGRRAAELSHGQKQRLELAMVVGLSPRLILLDEPTAGMTRRETERTAELLRSLVPRHAVVVVEHDMDFVERLEAPVAVLHLGRLLTEGPLAQVRADERVREVYLGRRKEQAA
ncbi:MAG: ATP-binding cassette domain-containing protein [Acidobacteria bacterium]|nr:ATP-binding cassette domain-containing protein [Acidobacteriota bacterium]